MEDETRFEKIKAHFSKHKHAYGYTACGVIVAVLGAAVLKKQPSIIVNNVSPVFNNLATSSLGGHLRKIVYCRELDRYFGSVTEAAKNANVSVPVMSKHLNGHTDHVNGVIYEIVAVAT